MGKSRRTLGLATAAALVAWAGGAGAAAGVPGEGSPGNSAADIRLADCAIESSKEISYVAYLDDGTTIAKDEDIDTHTHDLTTVEDIEAYDAVRVKSGTTVESFDIGCTSDGTGPQPGEGDTRDDTGDDTDGDDGTGEDGSDHGDLPWGQHPNPSSRATITVDDCLVESSKDISYVAYLDDGTTIAKDEDIDTHTHDLTTVEDIEAYDAVRVKSGTTVESFDIGCTSDGTGPQPGEGDTGDDGTGEDGSGDDTDAGTDEGADEGAVISLSGCVVESTKAISYIQYFADGSPQWKDESLNTRSHDLTQVDGIEDIDAIEVKSSTTVETFAIDCGTDEPAPQPGEGDTGGDDQPEPDPQPEPEPEPEPEPGDGDADDGADQGQGSGATITMSGCLVESSKDISYIQYFTGGSAQWKDESMNTRSYDLTQVDGIEDVDSIEVKSSTTVQRFSIDCGSGEGGTA